LIFKDFNNSKISVLPTNPFTSDIYILLHYGAYIKGGKNEMRNSYPSPTNCRANKTMKPERDEICNIHWEDE
jgi:hypothetical protein